MLHLTDYNEGVSYIHVLPSDFRTMDEIWADLPDEHKYAILVFEDGPSIVGVEVRLYSVKCLCTRSHMSLKV